ncbi:MAG: glycosyltransferase family 87 protein [Corynebacterium sp.]|uniref:glycosyltransferase family 87 protein n=1 Tax=Corynebacterium sp. TaxID=1720 RepID=UPI0026DAB4AF|nr:glycosyltransferase family 87 protein [Corynebacterium sp.]MDO5029494.1 glycosyltransferase family 87 protein [Corynebacterium sp.]
MAGRPAVKTPGIPAVVSLPILVVALLGGVASLLVWRGRTQPDDWASLWLGGLLMHKGEGAHLYDRDAVDFSAIVGDAWIDAAQEVSSPFPHPFVQNPLFATVLSQLTNIMSFETSVLWLLFISGAAVVIFVAASYHLWFHHTMPWGIAAVVAVVVLAMPTTINSLWLGQTTPLIVAGVAYGLAASRKRPWLAGIVLGLVASIKLTPYALIFVMLFFAYRRRAALWALGTTAVLVALMFATVDVNVIADWIERVNEVSGAVLVGAANQSISAMLAQDLGDSALLVSVVHDYPPSVKLIPFGLAIVVAIVTTAVSWWNREYRFELLVSGAWLTATAFSAIVWTHYMLMLVTPVMGLCAMANSRWTKQWPLIGVATVVLMLSFPVTNPIAATPYTSGYLHSGIAAMVCALVLIIAVGACHAASQSSKANQPEPMVLFDLFEGRN